MSQSLRFKPICAHREGTIDIAARKLRLDAAADATGKPRIFWFGEIGDACQRCHVEVPDGFLLALPESDIAGCLRCLELQAHLFIGGFAALPDDLAGTVDQANALRLIAEEFRRHVRALRAGREPQARGASWIAAADDEIDASDWSNSRRPMMQKRSKWRGAPGGDEYAEPVFASTRWPGKRGNARHEGDGSTDRATQSGIDARSSACDVLGLTGQPTRDEIMAAFRRSALISHPDHGGSTEAFRILVAARDEMLAVGE